jgi:hypothetical protein
MSRRDYLPEFECPMSDEEERWRWKAEDRQAADNEITRRRARERGLEHLLDVSESGWIGIPCEKFRKKIEEIKLDDRLYGNEIYILPVENLGKWTTGISWVSKDGYSSSLRRPDYLWSTLYDSREAALSAAWRWFEKKGIERPDAQPDLFGGDYS